MERTSNVLLLNSFGFFSSFPSVSMAKVAALLNKVEIKAHCLDINLILWNHLLDVDYLKSREYRPEMGSKTRVPFPLNINEKTYEVLKDNVVKNIQAALKIFKSKNDFYQHDKLNWAVNIVFQAQQVLYYHFGTFITNKVIFWPEIGFNVNNLEMIYQLSDDHDHNPFIALFDSTLLPHLESIAPEIIGIDIAFPWEILPALTMNKLIKNRYPNIHINFTGHGFDEMTFARVGHRLEKNPKLFFSFDSVFLLRNDAGLKKFYSEYNGQISNNHAVDSLAIKSGNEIVLPNKSIEDINEQDLIPDYNEFPLSEYYTPDLVLIDKTSNKCFWSKCAFCNINLYKKDYYVISPEQFYARMLTYSKNYKVSHFFLLDEAMDPDYASSLSDVLLKNNANMIWSMRTRIDHRMDKELLKKLHSAGCRELWIGMENASENLLEKMNKCKTPKEYLQLTENIIKNCSEIGIGLHFCLLFGFPLETKNDQTANYVFFKKLQRYFKKMPFFATFNIFNLNYGSDVYKNPSKYMIKNIDESEENFNMINIPYTTTNGNDLTNKEYEANVDKIAEKLCAIFVPSQTNQLLWFVVSDSPWELLYKKHYCANAINPFQKGGGTIENWLVKLYLFLDKYPFAKKILTTIDNKKRESTKVQIYR